MTLSYCPQTLILLSHLLNMEDSSLLERTLINAIIKATAPVTIPQDRSILPSDIEFTFISAPVVVHNKDNMKNAMINFSFMVIV